MYISGSLINQVINKNRNNISGFDNEKVYFDSFSLSYEGVLEFFNNENNIKTRTFWRQEELINSLAQNIVKKIKIRPLKEYTRNKFFNTLTKLLKSSRKYTYLFLEFLVFIINNSNNLDEDLVDFNKFYQSIYEYEKIYNFNQIDLNIMLDRLKKGQNYNLENLSNYYEEFFHLNDMELDLNIQTIVKFGEFINPHRLQKIAYNIAQDVEFTQYIAPIYFLLKDAKSADTFLYLNRKNNLNYNQILQNAKKCGANENIRELILKK